MYQRLLMTDDSKRTYAPLSPGDFWPGPIWPDPANTPDGKALAETKEENDMDPDSRKPRSQPKTRS